MNDLEKEVERVKKRLGGKGGYIEPDKRKEEKARKYWARYGGKVGYVPYKMTPEEAKVYFAQKEKEIMKQIKGMGTQLIWMLGTKGLGKLVPVGIKAVKGVAAARKAKIGAKILLGSASAKRSAGAVAEAIPKIPGLKYEMAKAIRVGEKALRKYTAPMAEWIKAGKKIADYPARGRIYRLAYKLQDIGIKGNELQKGITSGVGKLNTEMGRNIARWGTSIGEGSDPWLGSMMKPLVSASKTSLKKLPLGSIHKMAGKLFDLTHNLEFLASYGHL